MLSNKRLPIMKKHTKFTVAIIALILLIISPSHAAVAKLMMAGTVPIDGSSVYSLSPTISINFSF